MSPAPTDGTRYARVLNEYDFDTLRTLIEQISEGEAPTPAILLSDVTFTQRIGGIPAGTTFPTGTPHDTIFSQMASVVVVPPTYVAPSLSIAGSTPLTAEVGTDLIATITPTWTQNDAGAATAWSLEKNGTSVASGTTPAPYTATQETLGETTITYQGSVTYAEGPIKEDNFGDPSPIGQIPAGSVTSNVVTYSGKRAVFYGSDDTPTAPTGADIRDDATLDITITDDEEITLVVPVGALRVYVARLATERAIQSVKYVEQGNAEYKDFFVDSTDDIEGANGYAAAGYRIQSYLIPSAPEEPMTFRITF